MENSKIVDFYLGKVSNDEKFYLEDILKFSFEELESNHHYIQWMFPTDQKSNFNPKAELLTNEDVEQFKSNNLQIEVVTGKSTMMKNIVKELLTEYNLEVAQELEGSLIIDL